MEQRRVRQGHDTRPGTERSTTRKVEFTEKGEGMVGVKSRESQCRPGGRSLVGPVEVPRTETGKGTRREIHPGRGSPSLQAYDW